MNNEKDKKKPSARRLARIAAVQALYQIEQTGEDPKNVILQFLQFRVNGDYEALDRDFFADLLSNIPLKQNDLDTVISSYLNDKWQLSRLPMVIKCILRAAIFELQEHHTTPTPVIINEYIEVTKEFFQKSEVSFVNGILDNLVKEIRPNI
jgi:N utilization substance protein B